MMKQKIMTMAMATIALTAAAQGGAAETVAWTSTPTDSVKAIMAKAEAGDAACQNEVGGWYYAGRHVARDYATAARWWRQSGNQGNVLALGNLALCYQHGRGVERDSLAALRLYNHSLKHGNKALIAERERLADNATAFDNVLLGLSYQKGNGVKKDIAKAKSYYEAAVKQGSADAARELGLISLNEKRAVDAVPLFKQAADADDLTGIYYYGLLRHEGRGCPADKREGVIYLLRAAERDYAAAQNKLGNLYATGDGVAHDDAQAVKWYRRAAAAGSVHSMWSLAECYRTGTGLDRDYEAALHWYAEAAALGYQRAFKKRIAQNDTVMATPFGNYLRGMKLYSIDKDYEAALKEFKALEKAKCSEGKTLQAAVLANKEYAKTDPKRAVKLLREVSDSYAMAAFLLGSLTEVGKGTDKDMASAVKLYEQASAGGYAPAQCYLGDLYYEGRGVEQDYKKAVELYELAASQRRLTANARSRLIDCYENGTGGIAIDKERAKSLAKEKESAGVTALLKLL